MARFRDTLQKRTKTRLFPFYLEHSKIINLSSRTLDVIRAIPADLIPLMPTPVFKQMSTCGSTLAKDGAL